MNVLKGVEQFSRYLEKHDCHMGCFADTGFLYAVSYQDDRLYDVASQVHDLLAERKIPIHANVISRMEFVDLIFRKQITFGAIQLFDAVKAGPAPKSLFNLLKNIRDKDTASQKEKKSYKIDEGGVSDEIESPLLWKDMVEVMGEYGLRGPDAMIVNLFSKSKFPVLITADGDFESCLSDPLVSASDKTIFLLT